MSKIRDHQSTQPVIRFKGFTDAWEKRKLGNLAEIVRGASPRPIQDPKWFDSSSEIGWLRIADVTEQNGRIHHLEQHISKAGQEKTRVLTQPHLLLSIAATVGKPLINYVSTGVHDGFLIFLKPKFELEFMYQWLEYFRPYWQKYGQPGSQVNLNSELVRNQSLHLPVVEEQIKIGHFGTIPCQVDTYKNENTIFLIRPNRGNIPPRFGHFF
ncbi:restriction endonuclease subunit S [Lactobacillus paracasei]|nr:restriction endonuclease subunit S [Lacticaseibacillus paracasei]